MEEKTCNLCKQISEVLCQTCGRCSNCCECRENEGNNLLDNLSELFGGD